MDAVHNGDTVHVYWGTHLVVGSPEYQEWVAANQAASRFEGAPDHDEVFMYLWLGQE